MIYLGDVIVYGTDRPADLRHTRAAGVRHAGLVGRQGEESIGDRRLRPGDVLRVARRLNALYPGHPPPPCGSREMSWNFLRGPPARPDHSDKPDTNMGCPPASLKHQRRFRKPLRWRFRLAGGDATGRYSPSSSRTAVNAST